jgi:hypothetical protein
LLKRKGRRGEFSIFDEEVEMGQKILSHRDLLVY